MSRLYVTEKLDIESEYYLAMTISREQYAPVLLMCKGGGTSIEDGTNGTATAPKSRCGWARLIGIVVASSMTFEGDPGVEHIAGRGW